MKNDPNTELTDLSRPLVKLQNPVSPLPAPPTYQTEPLAREDANKKGICWGKKPLEICETLLSLYR